MQSIDSKILSMIYGSGRGSVFTPGRFLDLGSRDAAGNTGTLPVFPVGWQGVKFKLLSPGTEVKSI